jgi:IS1 family transposase
MNRLSNEHRAAIVAQLVEGTSINATCRILGVAKNTVLKLLRDLGPACEAYQREHLRNLRCAHLECDEIWSFTHCKQKNIPVDKRGLTGHGDTWLWIAIDAESKLVPCWLVGDRDADHAARFMADLASRLAVRAQLTTDGHRVYVEAVEKAFGSAVDYAMLIKLYGSDPESETRYSPARCIGILDQTIQGTPDRGHVSTSYAERNNRTVRMSMRRYTRLTDGFSKKIEMHRHAVALHFMHYNFARQNMAHRLSPAMAARVTDHLWSVAEIAALA